MNVPYLKDDVAKAAATIREGGIILYPTDTIWGLGCDATNESAIRKIYDIKHRSLSKSMIILCRDTEMIYHYVEDPADALLNEMEKADAPTTAIFSNCKNLPGVLTGAGNTIAIRIPGEAFCQALLRTFNKPIVSTSANISQHGSPHNFSEIDPALFSQVDYTVFFRREDDSTKNPSRIIRLNEHGELERVR